MHIHISNYIHILGCDDRCKYDCEQEKEVISIFRAYAHKSEIE